MDLLAINPGLIVWTIITFVILFLLLKKFVWGPVLDAVERREQSLKDLFDNAEKNRKEAQELFDRYQEQLRQARIEVNKMLEDSKAKAFRTSEEVIQRARREADDLIQRAKSEIDRERQKAVDGIRDQVVKISLKAAERIIKKMIDEREHRELIQQAISDIDTTIK